MLEWLEWVVEYGWRLVKLYSCNTPHRLQSFIRMVSTNGCRRWRVMNMLPCRPRCMRHRALSPVEWDRVMGVQLVADHRLWLLLLWPHRSIAAAAGCSPLFDRGWLGYSQRWPHRASEYRLVIVTFRSGPSLRWAALSKNAGPKCIAPLPAESIWQNMLQQTSVLGLSWWMWMGLMAVTRGLDGRDPNIATGILGYSCYFSLSSSCLAASVRHFICLVGWKWSITSF